MNSFRITPTITIFLPILGYIPIFLAFLTDVHSGGLTIILAFFKAAITPSFDSITLRSAFNGIQITLASALLGWIIIIILGTFLGLISSNVFWKLLPSFQWAPLFLRSFLSQLVV